MKVKILEKSKEKLVLKVDSGSDAYMNTLRRLLMNEVPVMAIEDVEFRKNSSILYDEIIAHRLGLIPLSTDLKAYKLPSEAKDPESPQVKLKLTLKGKAEKEPKTLYAKDIKSKDPKVKPVYPGMPIVKLLPGQELQCEMTAMLGQGKEHSKWSGCLAWFKHYPHVKVAKQPAKPKELAERYPNVFQVKQGKLTVNQDNLVKYDVIGEEINEETNGAITYEEKDDFVLFIESWGQLDAKKMLLEAVNIHNQQLKDFKKLLKKK